MKSEPAHLAEHERNRLLRRIDWRFLLDDPCLGTVLCLADGEIRQACDLVAARVDTAPDADHPSYDLVVLTAPHARALDTARRHLRGGGQVYGEWPGTDREEVERLLVAAGFGDVACYWPWPKPPAAEVWVPHEIPWAFDYYRRVDRHVYSGARHRWGTLARRSLARWRLARRASAPVCAVARKPGTLTDDAITERDIVRSARAEARIPPDARLTTALFTGGPRAISKVIGLAYTPNAEEPVFAIKWPRVAESAPGLAREADALTAAHSRGPVAGVPRLLGRTGEHATLAIAEAPARGVPMFVRLSRSNVKSLTRLGASWLADFNLRERRPSPDRSTLRGMAEHDIGRFRETFGPVVDGALIDETARLCAGLSDVPYVIEHRDFGPWNIFVDDTRRLTVLDWESSRLRGLPLLDLLYLVTYMTFFVEGAMVSRRFVEAYRVTLDPRTSAGALRHELIEQHRETLGLTNVAVRALRALCWIGHAESEFQHFSADAAGPPTPDALRASVFVRLWKEEITSLR